ncbi:MAG: type I 3-dehydroquinate dehydratase [Candidatus Delongbacteria bacterium]|nr:type I 3-dehydroquinate dehydratase [Candidatus Delongbacteria bacterium]
MLCLSVGKATVEECLEIIKNSELSEIRLDLNIYHEEDIKRIFSSGANLIATCREGKYNNDERKNIISKAIEFGAKYVDVELTCDLSVKDQVINVAKKSDCKVIISYHNHDKCPNKEHMKNIINRCFDSKADIAKIVAKVNTSQDIMNIMSLYDTDKEIIALGMGELGRITRVAAPFFGAPFTYAYPKGMRRTAHGQFSEEKMRDIINLIS